MINSTLGPILHKISESGVFDFGVAVRRIAVYKLVVVYCFSSPYCSGNCYT